jgi:hypothetical protein
MRPTGFSTGALTKGDFQTALSWLENTDSDAIELSALREEELPSLVAQLKRMNLRRFQYKSIHAPKSFERMSERAAVQMLVPFAKEGFRIILHPDAIKDVEAWKELGSALCLENMDMRKHTGRTADELGVIFGKLPAARFCLDVGHARQVDPSMAVAIRLVHEFGDRLEQVHASEVDTAGNHVAMSEPCMHAFDLLIKHIGKNVAVIVESQVSRGDMKREIAEARTLFGSQTEV